MRVHTEVSVPLPEKKNLYLAATASAMTFYGINTMFNICLVGNGAIAAQHMKAFCELGEVRPRYVVSRTADKAWEFAQKWIDKSITIPNWASGLPSRALTGRRSWLPRPTSPHQPYDTHGAKADYQSSCADFRSCPDCDVVVSQNSQ